VQSNGLGRFSEQRYSLLKQFSPNFPHFYTQLAFIAYELRGTKNGANIRLLRSDKIKGKEGTCEIFCRYYLQHPSLSKQTQFKAQRLLDRIG
jgi:hypothetical protein